jgi:methyl-accepting chemotaxis protein
VPAATSWTLRPISWVAAGTEQVSSNIVRVSEGAQETGTAAHQVRSASSELARQSDGLTTTVSEFLTNVRAA